MAKQVLVEGLVQFDSSGNDPVRERVVRAVSHPDPLPQGEGTARNAQRKPKGPNCTPCREEFTLSPRERAGVRGNRPPHGAGRMSSACRAADARRAISGLVGIHNFKLRAVPEVSDFSSNAA